MNRFLRRALLGALSGLFAAPILVLTVDRPGYAPVLGTALGMVVGALVAMLRRPASRPRPDLLMEVAALGVPLWALVDVLALPLLHGEEPRWNASAMRGAFPALAGWILFTAA